MDLILTVAIGAALAGFVQGLSGFGFGLTAMSIWAWTLEPKLAASLAVFGGLVGQTIAAFTVRRGWDWRAPLPLILGGPAGPPLRLWAPPRPGAALVQATLRPMLVIVCPP